MKFQHCQDERSIGRNYRIVLSCIAIFACNCTTRAADVTNYLWIGFDGEVTGSEYVLDSTERDLTGSFAVSGTPTVADGLATVPGSVDDSSGFYMNANSIGSLNSTNWMAEVRFQPSTNAAGQPGLFNHLLDVQGDTYLRYNSYDYSRKRFELGFYDGQEHRQLIASPSSSEPSLWVLAWDASSHTLSTYRDGVQVGSQSGSEFATPSPNVGFGFFARTGFFDRAVDGTLDAVAFSTYQGELDPSQDFQLYNQSAPLGLEVSINPSTGSVLLSNPSGEAVAINGYELTSSAASLSSDHWLSLAEQQASSGSTTEWLEGGFASDSILFEASLEGEMQMEPGQSLWLGYAFTPGAEENIEFRYRRAGQSGLEPGTVNYDGAAALLAGDYNADGLVNLADYIVWRNHLGSSYSLPNDATPATVDADDYQVWKNSFGSSAAPASVGLQQIPEPRTVVSIIGLIAAALLVRGGRLRSAFAPLALLMAMALATPSIAQTAPAPYGAVPTERQLAWHQQEYYAFLHFGPNTFTDEEWGWSQSTPDVFNPTELDTDQWAQSIKDAGMTGMILTAKHHDGMALWDTATTEYRINNGAWASERETAGLDANVVRMAAESAKAQGLKFGIYLSPWDMHRDPAVSKTHLQGTKYDEPQIFGDANGSDYNDLYAAQLTELVTMELSDGSQIELSEVWLDGASGSSTVQTFDWNRYRDIIREYQMDAVMWGHQGVDARWVGNEDGYSPPINWHTIDRTQDQTRYSAGELQTGVRNGAYWTPAEADARLRSGWFYHDDESPKSTSDLMDMYMNTVGRSVNLLLDVPPGPDGKLAAEDVTRLVEFRTAREDLLGSTLFDEGTTIVASATRGDVDGPFRGENLLDGDINTYWTMDDGQTTGSLELDLGGPRRVTGLITKEYIALGQRIGSYSVDALVNGSYTTVATGNSLGYQRIHVFDQAVETSKLRFRITQADAVPILSELEVLGEVLVGITGDVNSDGQINVADWTIYIQWAGANLDSYTAEDAFARGDLNGDFRNDLADFDLFVTAYEKWNGAGSFAEMATTVVPEPACSCLLITGVLIQMSRSKSLSLWNRK